MSKSFSTVDRPARREETPLLPLESGRPRVQRLVDDLAPVHLELELPVREIWTLVVDGLVSRPIEFTLDQLCDLGVTDHAEDFHCIWGWSCPQVKWSGVSASVVLDLIDFVPGVTHLSFGSFDSPYASCVPLEQAQDGFFAIAKDAKPLSPIHGGPLRWVQPHYLWAYKGVKWVSSITALDHERPGFWEEKVGDVAGHVPEGVLALFESSNEDVGQ